MSDSTNPPLMNLLAGADPVAHQEQEDEAWRLIAEGYEAALNVLDVSHPERQRFLQVWMTCRDAAGLPLRPDLRLPA